MNKKKRMVCFLFSLCSLAVLYGKNGTTDYSFHAVLLKAEISSDLYQPEDTLLVTCWFQNVGNKASEYPLKGFAELSFGHQRILENTPEHHRYYWDPYPSTVHWKPGDVWKTTFKCKMNLGWGGTYSIRIGLCDETHLPVKITGAGGKLVEQVEIGTVDLGWSWGTPTMDQVRKSWSKEFNKIMVSSGEKNSRSSSIATLGTGIKINLNPSVPEIETINGIEMDRSSRGMLPAVTIRNYTTDSLIHSGSEAAKIEYAFQQKGGQADYKGRFLLDGKDIAAFTFRFETVRNELHLSLTDVKEKPGYELLEISIPSLLSLGGDVEIINFTAGGRLIPLDRAVPEGYSFKYDTRNAAALLRTDDKLVLESTCIDDRMNIAVFDNGEKKTANLGMVFVNRVRGKGKIASIPVEQDHTVKISLLDPVWGNDGWQSAARFWRKDLKSVHKDLYRRALVYKQLATSGPEPPAGYVTDQSPYSVKRLTAVIPFKKIAEINRKYYHILDGMPQVLYIGGFQEGGFDNSYPYVLNTDRRIGTVEELRNYIKDAGKYNTILSLHDNYDSDVLNSPYYDPRIACMDAEGKPWMGWFWAGGTDHIVSPFKYGALGLMQQRVKETVNTYGIKGSYHLDVLTSELLRYDFDPQYPASAAKSLEGKLNMIKEFNKYGIDITSETLLHPFVGHIGFALHARTDLNTVFFTGEKFIPLVDMVYHGTISYEGGGRSEQAMLMGLMKGSSIFIGEEDISEEDIQWIYLHQMPVGLLYDKKMDRITNKDGVTTVVYDPDTYVKVDFKEKSYEVKVDGRIVAKDWTTFIPGFKPDTYLAYSVKGGAFSYPVPEGWDKRKKIKAVTLTFDGEGVEVPCAVENGIFSMNIPASTPVRVFCTNAKNISDKTEVQGLYRLSEQEFPFTEGSIDLNFPNGNLKNVKNQWPLGGWMVPDRKKITGTIASLIEYNQEIPKPAEIAHAMNMTLGEYDFVCSRMKDVRMSAAWDDPSQQHDALVKFVNEEGAPGGHPYFHFEAGKNTLLRSPDFRVDAGKPHFISFWMRSFVEESRSPEFYFWYNAGLEDIRISYYGLSDTKGEWKRFGLYFRALSDADSAHFTLYYPGNAHEFIDAADFQLREVSEAEFSKAYAAERKKKPEYKIPPMPDDGKFLAASIAKLEGKLGIPGRPFVIWGVGSSHTNFLDDLEPVRQAIRHRFPNSPGIIYRKQVGSGCPYDFVRGWVHTEVLTDQPDLILSYTDGNVEALESMLKDIRQHSTADIIVPSLHFFENEQLTPDVINKPVYDRIRNVCKKYNAQFVDNRKLLANWLQNNNLQPDDLLSDAVHQNDLGRLLTCENIGQQFMRNTSFAYDPDEEEQSISLVDCFLNKDPRITFSGEWSVKDNRLISHKAGAALRFKFTGTRIDLIGEKKANSGQMSVFIDGKPAEEAPAFCISYIKPAITNISHTGQYPRSSKGNADTGPHGVFLGSNVNIPQEWTIRMIDNEGNYELDGSITGKDGTGNNTRMFTGKSGQIEIDPAVWRAPGANVKGDFWMFNVTRCVTNTVDFTPEGTDKEGLFSLRLVQNLNNSEHTVELKSMDGGETTVQSFYVFTPQLK